MNLGCFSPLQGSSMRVTRLDACGNPEYGDCGFAVSDGFVSATLTPNTEEGDRFLQRGANGRAIVNQRSATILNWYDVSIQFQEVDPELFTIITGLDPAIDDQDRTIGFTVTESKFATANFALELWLGNSEEECLPGDPLPYFGYSFLPWVTEGALAEDFVVTNDLITFTVAGRTRKGTPWGTGPYDVVLDAGGDPQGLYEPLPTDTHFHQIWTQVAPPEPVCGCQSLSS